jgi:hypothetical protein
VLSLSRRRCALCYGLNRDTKIKSGQIAHIDRNNENNSQENLCFLCFEHHDEYDSKTSQRKNFSQEELKKYRSELYDAINQAFSLPVHFGEVSWAPGDPYAGTYIRLSTNQDTADFTLIPISDSLEGRARYFASGSATWGSWRESGPNIGELSIVLELEDGYLHGYYYSPYVTEIPYSVTINFSEEGATLQEQGVSDLCGFNVSFSGKYNRVK